MIFEHLNHEAIDALFQVNVDPAQRKELGQVRNLLYMYICAWCSAESRTDRETGQEIRAPMPATFAAIVTPNIADETVDAVRTRLIAQFADSLPIRVRSKLKSKNADVIETVSQEELDKLIAYTQFQANC